MCFMHFILQTKVYDNIIMFTLFLFFFNNREKENNILLHRKCRTAVIGRFLPQNTDITKK